MHVHVTFGRGTEEFVKKEVLKKLDCHVKHVGDGKLFMEIADVEDAMQTDSSNHRNIFNLKTVERVFTTVTWFPTQEIKSGGKVKFLKSLKDRIVSSVHLQKAAKDVRQWRKLKQEINSTGQHTHSCGSTENTLVQEPTAPLEDMHKIPTSLAAMGRDSCRCQQSVTRNERLPPYHSDQASPDNSDPTKIVPNNVESETISLNAVEMSTQCMHRSFEAKVSDFNTDKSVTCNAVSSKSEAESLKPAVDCFCNDESLMLKKCDNYSACSRLPSKRNLCAHKFDKISNTNVVNDSLSCSSSYNEPSTKRQKLDQNPMPSLQESSQYQNCTNSEVCEDASSDSKLSFRFSVKCGGWCKKWMQPQRLAKELGVRLTILMGWAMDLHSPDLEICVHVNDDLVVVGIPLARKPLSARSYIPHPGLRSTVSYVMASLADIQPGHAVLDPMCGKATILVEAAKEFPDIWTHRMTTQYLGCDLDNGQLQTALKNVKMAQVDHCVHLLQADALNLPFKSSSINRIVCDAPFGQKFCVASDLPCFYRDLMQEMCRLLVPGGIAVLLTSQDLLPVVAEIAKEQAVSVDGARISLQVQASLPSNHSSLTRSAEDHPVSRQCEKAREEANVTHSTSNPSKSLDSVLPTWSVDDASSTNSTGHSVLSTRSVDDASSTNSTCHSVLSTRSVDDASSTNSTGHSVLSTRSVDDASSTNSTGHSRTLDGDSNGLGAGGCAGGFSLSAKHYIKLGETHAYIVVLKKL